MTNMEIKSGQVVHAKPEGEAKDADGKKVGTVDRMEGKGYVKLKSNDSTDGKSHWIPLNWAAKADDKAVYLSKTYEEFKRDQLNELPSDEQQKKAV